MVCISDAGVRVSILDTLLQQQVDRRARAQHRYEVAAKELLQIVQTMKDAGNDIEDCDEQISNYQSIIRRIKGDL